MSSSAAVLRARELAQWTPAEAAAHWRRRGRGSYGCLPTHMPRALVAAAGLIPLTLEIGPDAQGCALVSGARAAHRAGVLAGLSGVVLAHRCPDSARIASDWEALADAPPLFVISMPTSGQDPIAALAAELERFREHLEQFTTSDSTDHQVEQAMDAHERARTRLCDLYAVRGRRPDLLPFADHVALVQAGGRLDAAEHEALLASAVADLQGEHPPAGAAGPRIILEGVYAAAPPPGLVRALESSGCHVVDDDVGLGMRWARFFDDGSSPLERMARAWLLGTLGAGPADEEDGGERMASLMRRRRALHADGIVVVSSGFCRGVGPDAVSLGQALAGTGVPFTILDQAAGDCTEAAARAHLQPLIDAWRRRFS